MTYGICIQPQAIQRKLIPSFIHEAGAYNFDWIRLNVYWNAIERKQGVFDWSEVDSHMLAALQTGMQVLAQIAFTPTWASGKTSRYPATDPELWKNFVRLAVDRYKNMVGAWEIWNEPDLPTFWRGNIAQYVQTVVNANSAILSVDPNATTMIGAFAHIQKACGVRGLLHKSINMMGVFPFSGISFHEYDVYLNTFTRDIKAVKQLVDVPIWLTETGQPSDIIAARDIKFEGSAGQALWAKTVLPQVSDLVQVAFWYQWIDNPEQISFASQGLVDVNLLEKPVLDVFA